MKAAEQIKSDSDVFGCDRYRWILPWCQSSNRLLEHHFANLQTKEERKAPQILYAGNSISSTYLADLVEYVADKDFSVNVISKSGTTTEPAIASVSSKNSWLRNTVKKKQTNVSMQQLTAKKVLLRLKQTLTVGNICGSR